MTRLVTDREVSREQAIRALQPRDGLVKERASGHGRFKAATGPVRWYRRDVRGEDLPNGRVRLRETIAYELAVPFFGWLFEVPFRRAIARGDRSPWWAPPDRLDSRAATALATLAVASIIGGYLGGLLSHTIAFAGQEFGADAPAQGAAGIAARFGGVLAIVAAASAADRLGRRRVILATALIGCIVTAIGALAPTLVWHAVAQAVARSLGLALLVCVTIAGAEEMPKGSRAYAASILGMSAALGSGIGIVTLPLADLAPWGWRLLHVLPLVALPVLLPVRKHLRETRRFTKPHGKARWRGHMGRFWLLGISAILANVFIAPTSFFLNRFLVEERGFSATAVAVFTLVTATPGAIGVMVGGRLADTRGRRPVGAIATAGAVVFTVIAFRTAGAPMWIWTLLAAVVGSAAVPALGVYGPELFPTALRGRVGGFLSVAGLIGSATGLVLGGAAAERPGGLTDLLLPLAFGPLVVCVMVLLLYPETARKELEDLNPEDRTR